MSATDKFFDINMVLVALFSSLETIIDEKNIELIYDIDATVPKELRGNSEVLSHLLTQVLTFVFENSNKKEIVLSLLAPKDFLYEESISFEIKEHGINKEKVTSFLENRLSKNLELLNAEIIGEDEDPSDIHINIPFKLNELGNRRYYRLPHMSMLGKKVLLISESPKIAQSIAKMFKYFLYDVVVGLDEYKSQGSDMTAYGILIIDTDLTTDTLENLMLGVQKKTGLKFVLLQGSKHSKIKSLHIEYAFLFKPVMQESIYKLIISLFESNVIHRKMIEDKNIIDIEKYINKAVKKIEQNFTKKNVVYNISRDIFKDDEVKRVVLDIGAGKQNTDKIGLVYAEELNKFLGSFIGSDRYFRNVVNDKQTWQIKEFCIDLEKQAKTIGAESMSHFANNVSLLFIYDNLDMLPVYTNKYHLELTKLIAEIKAYLDTSSS